VKVAKAVNNWVSNFRWMVNADGSE